ncbi:MAG: YajQ family cyclic di-GMP-binding protein [Nitrospirota bacterium]|nr:YajQ family cyclic di-GMP-binding protein [Nitrospirota bacterium]
MPSEASFDIVSKVDMQEAKNAVDQALKEIGTRFDLKDSGSRIEWDKEDLVLTAKDSHKIIAVVDILESKIIKRGISLKNLDKKKIEEALGGTSRQRIVFKQGLTQEIAKDVVREIKAAKLKVQPQVQGDSVRVTGKSRDDLQEVIALLKRKDFGIDLQYTNYR